MMSRIFSAIASVALLVGLASAGDTPASKASPPRGPRVKQALEAGKTDLPRAIAILEQALQESPKDRDALYLLGAMATVRGGQSDDPAERIALFRKATAAFARLQESNKELSSYEKAFLARSRVGEACVLAFEGKVARSLGVIERALADGFEDIDAFNDAPELEPVRKLPGFRAAIENVLRPHLLEEMASVKPFPFDFTLKDLDGQVVRLADTRGKVTIVDLWGTWCPPCRAEIPHIVELHQKYKARGLEVIGVNCEEVGTPAEIRKKIRDFARATGISYKCVLNDGTTEAKIPGFQGYPSTLFLDRSGRVRTVLFGYTPKEKLELIVSTLLAEGPNP
ncbi:MAG: redoxin domain-containing protein [Isosphaeraceae bacterium]